MHSSDYDDDFEFRKRTGCGYYWATGGYAALCIEQGLRAVEIFDVLRRARGGAIMDSALESSQTQDPRK